MGVEAPPAKILVVDDEPGIQRTVQRILGRRNHVSLASSGAEALQVLAREPHDLAIVDVRMPGMNGFEVLRSIKARHPDTEVIIMTGSVSNPEEKLVEALRERAFYFINKPFEKAVLETLVDRCLEHQRLEREKRAWTRTLERDLQRARTFQRLLLPGWFPHLPGVRGDVWYEPSERLGGDFYDFFRLGPSALGVVLADVNRKCARCARSGVTSRIGFDASTIAWSRSPATNTSLRSSRFSISRPGRCATRAPGTPAS
jgi:CheY-like chemotaxis protein